ncbi:MAG TPA: PD-(D/E)XK nuclease family protein [Natronosporangium sp.]|nr:PD-(D/E)XK nuclease family protein [Natronosporangium sp.]
MSRTVATYRLVRRPPVAPAPPTPDEQQQRVVAHDRGPLLVLGGPGTGKTTMLVEAVAARVAAGIAPDRLLVLTFGRRGAATLRQRIAQRIAPRGVVTPPLVRTFPGYAFGLLRRAAVAHGEPPPRLLTGPEQDAVIRELLAGDPHRWPERLRAALPTREFAAQLRDLLLRATERGIGIDQLRRYAEQLDRPDWRAAAEFRREYEAVLALRDATGRLGVGYDPAELVRAAVGLLSSDSELLASERQRLAMIYVDEYADTDPAQRELLALVAGGGANLVVFADPDSATFEFRGSDPRGVRQFPDQFPTPTGEPAPVLVLSRCYRSGPELLRAADRVAGRLRGPARHRRRVATTPHPPDEVRVRVFRSAVTESGWIAHQLRELHLRAGVPWSRMAVLVRAGHQVAGLERALRAVDIPLTVELTDLPLTARPAVTPLLWLLRCAVEPDSMDEPTVVALLHSPLVGADPFTERQLRQGLRALARSAGDPRPTGELLVEAVRDPAELTLVERRWAAPALRLARLLATAREAVTAGATVEEVLWAVWQASGLAERWTTLATGQHREEAGRADGLRADAAERALDAVLALFEAAARFTAQLPGAGVGVFLDHLQSQQLPGDWRIPAAERGEAVQLLTVHAAKGREWDVVALPGVQEGIWPDLRLRDSVLGAEQLVDLAAGRPLDRAGQRSALLDEERRLFYVAVTRARRVVLATAVAAEATGVDLVEEPSRFLRELAGVDPDPEADSGPEPGPDAVPGPRGNPDPEPDAPEVPDPAPALPMGRLSRGMTLPALVAELRRAVADPTAPEARRRAAATQLARLALAGVRGAHPDQWWGLAPLSDSRPLAGPDDLVRVSPSAMESALRCSLRWLLERHGGQGPASAAQGVGNLVHAAAMLADRADVDRQVLLEWLDARFDAIEHAARWLAGPEHDRAEQMIDKLLRWVADNPRRLVAVEREFTVRVGRVELRGRVDRLEVDEHGRLVVVDLKTGKQAPPEREVDTHPQLGAYQAAVAAGAFAEYGTEPGGAALVQLGTTSREAREQRQPPLAEAEDPQWAQALLARTGEVMAGATFRAARNNRCRTCPVRTSCPISGQGRQVVQP